MTGADANYFYLARDLVESVLGKGRTDFAFGILDLGLDGEQCDWLRERGVEVQRSQCLLNLERMPAAQRTKMGYLARPFLRESFPGYQVYVWLDADTWLQDAGALDALVAGVRANGAAVVTQSDRAYRFWPWLVAWKIKHFMLGYGVFAGLWLATRKHINSGVFALDANAPHWAKWQAHYQRAIDRTGIPAPHDQFGLNAAVYVDALPTTFLPSTCNWICDLGTPMWDDASQTFCTPYAPHAPIGLLHLAGSAKSQEFSVKTTTGSLRRGLLRFNAVPAFKTNA